MKRNLIETILGAVVLFVAIFFVVTTYQSSGVKKDYQTKVFANFDKVDGITTGSDVRLGGIKIGSVIDLTLDPKSYRARLDIGIQDKIGIPTDSSAVIASDGLLGGKYVNIIPGADEAMLKTGGQIEFTQSSVNLEELIGKFAFGSANSGDKAAPKPGDQTSLNATPAAPAPETTPITPPTHPKAEIPTPKKASVIDVQKPVLPPTEKPQDLTPDALPPADQPASAAPTSPQGSVSVTPKIVKISPSGSTE